MDVVPYPFRSRLKTKALKVKPLPLPKYSTREARHYTLKEIHGRKSWMIDFISRPPILLMIHCNTRYLLAYMGGNAKAETVYEGLKKLYHFTRTRWSHGPTVDTLISETGIADLCRANNIKQIIYNVTAADNSQSRTLNVHNRLGIIDRACRTLKDMLFNVGASEAPPPALIAHLLEVYNNTPHETLTKTMGFDVTPAQAFNNKRLQDEIVRRWMQENQSKVEHKAFTDVKVGTIVFIPTPRQAFAKTRSSVIRVPYRVVERRGVGAYVIEPVAGVGRVGAPQGGPPNSEGQLVVQRKDIVIAPKGYQQSDVFVGSQDQGNNGYTQEEASERAQGEIRATDDTTS